MKVCHICSNYDKFFKNLMEEQISKGIDLKVFYFRSKDRGLPEVNSSYVDVRLNYRNWQRPFFKLKERLVLSDFYKIYKNRQFDIIHAHTLFSNGYIALKAKEKWGVPYIVAVRDMDVNVFLKYRVNLRKVGFKILREAEKIIFLSPSYRDFVLTKYVPKNFRKEFLQKSLVITNGLDPFFIENTKSRNPLNNKESIKIISVGHLNKRKNQLTVCKAVESLNKLGLDANYTIVGKIVDEKIFNKVKKYSFINYIPFLPKEKLIDEYRNADIFAMPSITETFGLTYVEAMSQGLPIIYSKGQGFDGQFKEGEVGYHVDSLNAEDIKNKVINIIENYDLLSSNCVNLSKSFKWEKIAEEYSEIYREICKI